MDYTFDVNRAVSSAHASTANLGAGYDILAVSLDLFHDTVEIVQENGSGKITLVSDCDIPLNPDENSAGIPVLKMAEDFGIGDDLTIRVSKGVPTSSGLGGSGSSAAASAAAMNELYSLGLDRDALVYYASLGEAATGEAHYDNVSASVYGNMAIVLNDNPVKVTTVNVPHGIRFLIVLPLGRLKTNTVEMRRLVPRSVSLEEHTGNSRFLSSLISGILRNDRDSIRHGLDDVIVQPARSSRYQYFTGLKTAAEESNALGAFISGSGPSVAVMIDEETDLVKLKKSIGNTMSHHDAGFKIYETAVAGGVVVEQ